MKKYKEVIFNGKYMCKTECRGVQRYSREVLQSIDKLVLPNTIKVIVPHKLQYEDQFQNIKIVKYGGHFTTKLWQNTSFQWYIWTHKAFSISLSDGIPLFNIGIAAIHDVRFLQDIKKTHNIRASLGLLYNKFIFKNALKRAKKIITVSEFSKKEIIKAYKIKNFDKILVCYNAWQHLDKIDTSEDIFTKNNILKKGEYFFTLGGNEESKNIYWILKMVQKYPQNIFVMAGPQNVYFPSENISLTEYKNFIHLGYVSDIELKSLMKYCKAFLFPSKYEGFGIPPMEAISVGAKALVSNAASLPEIYKNYVSYFDPDDYTVDLEKLLSESPSNATELLDLYSWEKTAIKILNIIKEFLEKD